MVQTYEKNTVRQLSEHYSVKDFACKCSRCDTLMHDDQLTVYLERIGAHFGVMPKINSGYRCKEHNAEVGGASTSHHMRGLAADIRVNGVEPKEVAAYAESIGIQRIGLYDNFVHIGSDEKKRFWLGHEGTEVDTFGGIKTINMDIPVLKKGAKGETVKALQVLLIGFGYDCGPKGTDGSFGSATEAAVKQYQKDQTLDADGSVGRKTWTKLLGL